MPGRPPLDRTPEEAKAAKDASRVASKAKTKNVTLDNDAVEALTAYKETLAGEFGFTPSLSQTLKHLLKKAVA